MPDTAAKRRASRDKRKGKSPSTQAGEFVREEMHEKKEGKGNAKSRKQAIAIGLSKARRSGVDVPDKRTSSKKKAGTRSKGRTTNRSGEKSDGGRSRTKRTSSRSKRSSPTRGGGRSRAKSSR